MVIPLRKSVRIDQPTFTLPSAAIFNPDTPKRNPTAMSGFLPQVWRDAYKGRHSIVPE